MADPVKQPSAVGQTDEVALSVIELSKLLPVSENVIRDTIRRGELAATRIGRALFVFPSDLRKSPLGALWRETR